MAASKTAKTPATIDSKLIKPMMAAFAANTLPGEDEGFDDAACRDAAYFALETGLTRKAGSVAIKAASFTDQMGRLATRIIICNDDMPFLVDSVAAALVANGVNVQRVIHPVVTVTRNDKGQLLSLSAKRLDDGTAESVIYVEADRIDSKHRRILEQQLTEILFEVRCAVSDWQAMLAEMDKDIAALPGGEGAELIRWFQNGNMTVLGHEHLSRDGKRSSKLGISRASEAPILSEASVALAFDWFEKGGQAPLILKANRLSRVHRNVLLDLLLVPVMDGKKITALSVIAGLWTSEASASGPMEVPLLRTHMQALMQKFGFDPAGHAGKAMAHVLTALPHDLLVSLRPDDLERVTLTAMSLTDRPRPKLLAVRSPLGRHLFVFVWLRRDDVSTAMRQAISNMLTDAAGANLLGWSITLEDAGIALIRYTLDLPDRSVKVDEAGLDEKLELMVRGWEPAVEAELARLLDEKRAAAMLVHYGKAFSATYRAAYSTEEAAQDMLCLVRMEREQTKIVRLHSPDAAASKLGLKVYNAGGALPLSDVVPALENFGFNVIEESPRPLDEGKLAYIHDFTLQLKNNVDVPSVMARADILETALAQVLDGDAENDAFNQLIVAAALEPQAALWLRAWFRYLRQTGLSYGMLNVVEALAKNPAVTQAIIALFAALHDPQAKEDRQKAAAKLERAIDSGLADVAAIDEDRVLRLFRAVVQATLRSNAYAPAAETALAFKLDSAKIPGLPEPKPWREIWVYSPRVEGIHLRAGPVARGGLRWSDRRDDFRTEILGLMKAQRVKNAVIVPTGAKGGFYPKRLPDPRVNRDAWFEEGKESYRIFIRTLLSVTDNIVGGKIVHPKSVVIGDGDDPYFVVAADKGTATFSDTANAIAIEHGFWLGDAFASGGSVGYDHKAMGITAKGGWISVQRHFAEMGIDVQKQPVTAAGIGDMSGDVFGNGMLLSKAIKLVAAFDHRNIFIDPDPDPAKSWKERKRLFALPRSSWEDYDPKLLSKGGGIFSRNAKSVKPSNEICKLLGLDKKEMEPSELIRAILKSEVQLIWFGGIGTYVKDDSESNSEVGDHANDAIRVNAKSVKAKVIGEGANLGITQAGRIAFALNGGRINTDFIDNSAGVDCSDNEVNIKIALNTEMASGALKDAARVKLLASMTHDVAELVLEDNRLQTLALSVAEAGGARDLPAYVRLIETFETAGRLDRAVEGIAQNDELLRRVMDEKGLMRPELSVLLSTAKMMVQDAIEDAAFVNDDVMVDELYAAFPPAMVAKHKSAIASHRLRPQIIATKLANRMINRLGMLHPFELAEEEGCTLGEVARAFTLADRLFGISAIWEAVDNCKMEEAARLTLLRELATEVRAQMADIIRNASNKRSIGDTLAIYQPVVGQLSNARAQLLSTDAKNITEAFGKRLTDSGVPSKIAGQIMRLAQMDGAIGLTALACEQGGDPIRITQAFTALGNALGLGWAQGAAMQMDPKDPWERLLVAGLARDFQEIRLDFLRRGKKGDPVQTTDSWLTDNRANVDKFRSMIDRARTNMAPSAAMLAQIAGQARSLLTR
ncbi:NAD-glutamate dehydrogenase [Sphingorhabdus arenilitoris]|uniref:NAD-glutamate dehydrogenase n=1 Tax=Sphingorhabdus arenilitoris TaxID=1490041 RepID=A0ABV8RDS1_9SPHN